MNNSSVFYWWFWWNGRIGGERQRGIGSGLSTVKQNKKMKIWVQ